MLTKRVVEINVQNVGRPKIVPIFVIMHYIYELFPAFQIFSSTDVRRETHIAMSFTELHANVNPKG